MDKKIDLGKHASDPLTLDSPAAELAALRAGAAMAGVELRPDLSGPRQPRHTYSAPELRDRDPLIDKAAARWHSEDPRVLLLRALAEATERDAAIEATATRVAIPATRIPAGVSMDFQIPVYEPVHLIALELEPSELQGLELRRLIVGTRIVAEGGLLSELNRCWLPQLVVTPGLGLQLSIQNNWGSSRLLTGAMVCRYVAPRH
jgi:hypothetical protein